MKKALVSVMSILAITIGISSCKKNKEVPPADKLSTPQNIKVKEITPESVVLTWDAVAGAQKYLYIVDPKDTNEIKGESTTNEATIKLDTKVEHLFSLKATAEGKTDSDNAVFTIPAQGGPVGDFTATIKVDSITNNSALITVTPASEDTYSVNCIESEVFASMSENDILAKIKEGVAAGQIQLQNGEKEVPVTGLKHSTKYVVTVVGFNASKEPISGIIKEEFTTTKWEGPSDAVKAWLGTYEFKYEKMVKWYIDNKEIKYEVIDSASTRKVEIQPYEGEEAVLIYGLSNIDELSEKPLPAIGVIGENGELLPMAGIEIGTAQEGYIPTWMCFCNTGDDSKSYSFVSGEYPAYSLKDGEGTPYTGELTDKSKFTVESFAILACNPAQGQVAFYELTESKPESFHPAGKITYTKSGDEPSTEDPEKTFIRMGDKIKMSHLLPVRGIKCLEL